MIWMEVHPEVVNDNDNHNHYESFFPKVRPATNDILEPIQKGIIFRCRRHIHKRETNLSNEKSPKFPSVGNKGRSVDRFGKLTYPNLRQDDTII